MKNIRKLAITACLATLVLSACAQEPVKRENENNPVKGKGFAVLEMFTSEGCSSCPPADELMARIQKASAGKPVYILSYHVDYWNRQGWKDAYSSAEYSDRQRKYATWLNTPQIYTPQLVVNGRSEYVGSDEFEIRSAINRQLSNPSFTALTLDASEDHKNITVQYQATGKLKGTGLLVAAIQKSALSNVKAGENAGRSLSHIQIVRKLQYQEINDTGAGTIRLALPKDFDPQNEEIIGLIQHIGTGTIVGAAQTEVKSL